MADLTEIVDNLEKKIQILLKKYDDLKQKNDYLHKELIGIKEDNQQLLSNLETSENKIQTLKAANALLGSNEYKKETKLKINGLIREIDQCIVQLSE